MKVSLTEEEERQVRDFKDWMHENPEVSNEEFETTRRITGFLNSLPGVELLDLPVETGVLAVVRGGRPGKTVGLRCDIDALLQTEAYESPHKSLKPGVMHACGHDFHTAAVLGAALILSRLRDQMAGDALLLFQKAEETTSGAKEMLEAGLLKMGRPDCFFGLHNWPMVPAGKVVVKTGGLMSAKTNFLITIHGKGGHGSMPHLCTDPIVCAAAMIQSLQTVVSRRTDPLDSVVCSVTSINGGSRENLVVDRVEMTAGIRSLSTEAMHRAVEAMENIVKCTAAAYGCTCEIAYREVIPLVDNSPAMAAIARKAAVEIVGEDNVIDTAPTLASEDFALIMEQVPSFLYWFGSCPPGEEGVALHQDRFHTDDSAIAVAAAVMANAVFTA